MDLAQAAWCGWLEGRQGKRRVCVSQTRLATRVWAGTATQCAHCRLHRLAQARTVQTFSVDQGALAGRLEIDRSKVALFIPPGLKKFKLKLFEDIGAKIGRVVRDDPKRLDDLPDDIVPIVGCTPFLRPWIERWQRSGKTWIYWDRGYLRRVFATWLPKGSDMGIPGGFYRWHINTPQMREVYDVPDDRWNALKLQQCVKPWN